MGLPGESEAAAASVLLSILAAWVSRLPFFGCVVVDLHDIRLPLVKGVGWEDAYCRVSYKRRGGRGRSTPKEERKPFLRKRETATTNNRAHPCPGRCASTTRRQSPPLHPHAHQPLTHPSHTLHNHTGASAEALAVGTRARETRKQAPTLLLRCIRAARRLIIGLACRRRPSHTRHTSRRRRRRHVLRAAHPRQEGRLGQGVVGCPL